MPNAKTEALQLVKGWVRMPGGTKVRFREDGGEWIIDGLTELAVWPPSIASVRSGSPTLMRHCVRLS